MSETNVKLDCEGCMKGLSATTKNTSIFVYASATDVKLGNEEAYQWKFCNNQKVYLLCSIHVCYDIIQFTIQSNEIFATITQFFSDDNIIERV